MECENKHVSEMASIKQEGVKDAPNTCAAPWLFPRL